MKKIIFLALLVVIIVSCTSKAKQNEADSQTTQKESVNATNDSTAKPKDGIKGQTELFACPMHPEAQGKKDDKCSKCGMKLTEPVTEK